MANEWIQSLHTVQQTQIKWLALISTVFSQSAASTQHVRVRTSGAKENWFVDCRHDCRWDYAHRFDKAVLNMVADTLNHVHHTCILQSSSRSYISNSCTNTVSKKLLQCTQHTIPGNWSLYNIQQPPVLRLY